MENSYLVPKLLSNLSILRLLVLADYLNKGPFYTYFSKEKPELGKYKEKIMLTYLPLMLRKYTYGSDSPRTW